MASSVASFAARLHEQYASIESSIAALQIESFTKHTRGLVQRMIHRE